MSDLQGRPLVNLRVVISGWVVAGPQRCPSRRFCPELEPKEIAPFASVGNRWGKSARLRFFPKDNSWQTGENQSDDGILDKFCFWSQGRDLRPEPSPPPAEPHPAPVVRYLTWARKLRKDIDEQGWTLRQAARFHGISHVRVARLLKLASLAPDIQERVLEMRTATASYYVTEPKLRLLVACERDWDRQRECFAKFLAGELRLPSTKPVKGRPRRSGAPTGPA